MIVVSPDRRSLSLRQWIVVTLAALFAGAALAQFNFPALDGRVTDAAHILTPESRAALDAKLKALEDKSSIQLVVATVASLQGGDVESYANGLFRAWKLGDAKKNNGVLFLIAPGDRKMRIEVGYGLESVLTDAVSKVILTLAVAPRFKAGDFAGGVDHGVDAIIETLSTDQSEWTRRAQQENGGATADQIMALLIFALFVFILLNMARNARGGPPGRGGGFGRYSGGPVIFLPPSSGGWDSGGFGGGDGGFSGGGGSSGGGGASGDW
jgi:uncharacterized protein